MLTTKQIKSEYLITIGACMTLYIIFLFASVNILRAPGIGQWVKIALAIVTALPVTGTFIALWRYMKNSDEYIRALLTETTLISTGILLAISTVWGFLESFANFPRPDAYFAFVIFWAVFGIVGGIKKVC